MPTNAKTSVNFHQTSKLSQRIQRQPKSTLGLRQPSCLYQFLGFRMLQKCFFVGLVSRSSFYRFLKRNFDVWGSKSRFSHGRYCTNRLFTEIAFYGFRSRFFRFLEALRAPFLNFWALKTHLKIEDFGVANGS